MKSRTDRYGTVAVSIHWLSAVLILVLLTSGLCATNAINAAAKIAFLRFHIPVAIMILLLTLVRIVWWWWFDRKPLPVQSSPVWQKRAARWVHVAFYILILGMIFSGIGMVALSGAGPTIFGQSTVPLPRFTDYPPRQLHGLGVVMFVMLLVLHVAAALYHHYLRRDGGLRRMWYCVDHC